MFFKNKFMKSSSLFRLTLFSLIALIVTISIGCSEGGGFRNNGPDGKAFITTWKTDNAGATNNNQIKIDTIGGGYNYTIDWGDNTLSSNVTGDITHTYATPGTYTISISGDFPRIYFIETHFVSDAIKLLSVEQWGDIQWQSMRYAFRGCRNLVFNAIDVPDLSRVTDMSFMFDNAYTFNQDISAWDVSSVTNMSFMFSWAITFNQDLSSWDVSAVTNMRSMFENARAFNQNLSSWDVSAVTDMSYMFHSAFVFNQDISAWDVSSMMDMSDMFSRAYVFNQDISAWDVSSVTDMGSMFSLASSFNQDISTWNVSSVTNMTGMFSSASAFDQDLSTWDVSSVSSMESMFSSVTLSTENYDALLIAWSAQSLLSAVVFDGGNSQYSSSSQAARDTLTAGFGWVVTDGGVAP